MASIATRSLLVKPVSGDCNARCSYCFYRERPSDPYRGQSHRRMSAEVLEELVRQGMQLDRRAASFAWQGGEPTLAGLPFYQRVVALQQQYGRNGQAVSNALQTNGLLIDREWAAFLAQYQFLVGVSLDGPARYHDAFRPAADGGPTQARALAALQVLQEEGVACNVLTVVNRETAEHAVEIYDDLLAHGQRFLQFIPCVETDLDSGALAPFAVGAEQYADFLCALFDRWYNGGRPEASVRDFEAILTLYLGQEPGECCYQTRCGSYLVVEHNGDVYPCDFYVRPELRLGNLLETRLDELFVSEELRAFADAKAQTRPECERCGWLPFCRQGCPRFVGVGGEPRSYLCRAWQRFYAHSHAGFMTLRDGILRDSAPAGRGRDARRAGLPATPAMGRNDACPCGSGKKFKQCCGRR